MVISDLERLQKKITRISGGITLNTSETAQEESQRFGLLKIVISLANHKNDIVYKSKKTLRASKEKLEISLHLPSELYGSFQLNIRVIDLLANSQARFSQRIYLN